MLCVSARWRIPPCFASNYALTGNHTSYDSYGRAQGIFDIDRGSNSYTYNGYDELKTSKDPLNQVRTHLYDTLGQRTDIVDSAGTTHWSYGDISEARGRLTETISPGTSAWPGGQHLHYKYEPSTALGSSSHLESVDYEIDGVNFATSFEYDDFGRLEKIHYAVVGDETLIVVQYKHGDSGELTDLKEIGSGATKSLWHVGAAYEGQAILQESFGNGATTTYDYDAKRRWLWTSRDYPRRQLYPVSRVAAS